MDEFLIPRKTQKNYRPAAVERILDSYNNTYAVFQFSSWLSRRQNETEDSMNEVPFVVNVESYHGSHKEAWSDQKRRLF